MRANATPTPRLDLSAALRAAAERPGVDPKVRAWVKKLIGDVKPRSAPRK